MGTAEIASAVAAVASAVAALGSLAVAIWSWRSVGGIEERRHRVERYTALMAEIERLLTAVSQTVLSAEQFGQLKLQHRELQAKYGLLQSSQRGLMAARAARALDDELDNAAKLCDQATRAFQDYVSRIAATREGLPDLL